MGDLIMNFYIIENDCTFSAFHPFWQVCQVAAPTARTALYWPQVSGASVLLQADWRHTHRYFPDGDAGDPTSDHMTPVPSPCPPCIYSYIVNDVKKKKRLESTCETVLYFVPSKTL